jgi:hypothetical protein
MLENNSGDMGSGSHERRNRRGCMYPSDRVSGDSTNVGNRLDYCRGGGGRLVGSCVAWLAETDRRQRIASRLARRKLARCAKARRTYQAAIAIRIAAYAVILGLLGLFAWRVEATQERIARERELREKIERRQPEIDTQSRIVWADMCGIVGDSYGN